LRRSNRGARCASKCWVHQPGVAPPSPREFQIRRSDQLLHRHPRLAPLSSTAHWPRHAEHSPAADTQRWAGRRGHHHTRLTGVMTPPAADHAVAQCPALRDRSACGIRMPRCRAPGGRWFSFFASPLHASSHTLLKSARPWPCDTMAVQKTIFGAPPSESAQAAIRGPAPGDARTSRSAGACCDHLEHLNAEKRRHELAGVESGRCRESSATRYSRCPRVVGSKHEEEP